MSANMARHPPPVEDHRMCDGGVDEGVDDGDVMLLPASSAAAAAATMMMTKKKKIL